jgi:hypothetical protein
MDPAATSSDTSYRPPFEPSAAGTGSPSSISPRTGKPTLRTKTVYTVQYLRALQSRPPWLRVSQVLWVVLGGWLLFVAYALAGLGMLLSLIFAPFGVQAMKFAWYIFFHFRIH